MRKCRLNKQQGIGLLELMLSLAIIAILLIMATRYYQSASNSQAMSSALDEVNAVKSGVKNYLGSNTNASKFPTVAMLVSNGYLPQSYNNPSSANPWSGGICISASGATPSDCSDQSSQATIASTYQVSITGVPSSICDQLASRLKGTINTAIGESVTPCSSGAVGVNYIN